MKKKKNVYKPHRYKNLPKNILYVIAMAVLAYCFVVIGYSVAKPFGEIGEPPKPVLDSLTADDGEKSDSENSSAYRAYRISDEESEDLENLRTKLMILPKKDYNTVIVPIKLEGGKLTYETAYENAAYYEGSSYTDIHDICDAVKENGFTACAMINTMHDNLYPQFNTQSGFLKKKDKSLWLDNGKSGDPWLDPSSSEAKKYLSAISGEAAAAGFDYIICTDVEYPKFNSEALEEVSGNANKNDRYLDLADDVNAMSESAEAQGGKLWLEIKASELLSGTSEVFFKPNMLKTDKYILDIDMDGLKESGVIKAFDNKTTENIIKEVLEKTEKKIYKTSFIPEISTTGTNAFTLNEFKKVMEENNYRSYVIK